MTSTKNVNVYLCMRSLMHHPLGGCSKALAAVGAGVGLGARVYSLMYRLLTSLSERLWAVAAFVRVCVCVHSLVSVKTPCKNSIINKSNCFRLFLFLS